MKRLNSPLALVPMCAYPRAESRTSTMRTRSCAHIIATLTSCLMLSSRYHHHLWRIKDEFRKAVQERQEEERKLLTRSQQRLGSLCMRTSVFCTKCIAAAGGEDNRRLMLAELEPTLGEGGTQTQGPPPPRWAWADLGLYRPWDVWDPSTK